jgi:hypothetical protein
VSRPIDLKREIKVLAIISNGDRDFAELAAALA